MTLVKFNQPPVGKLIDSIFNDFVAGWPGTLDYESKSPTFAFPPVNIHETKDGYHLEMNVPGRSKEDFNVSVEDGLLTISYEKKEDAPKDEYKTIRREFSFSSFKRSFTLDETIQADNIQAKYENGVLKLYLPKQEPQKEAVKQISIQ